MVAFLPLFSLLALWSVPGEDALPVNAWLAKPGVKFLLVEFYASWCEPCIKSAPHLSKLHQTYYGKGLRLMVVAVQTPEGCPNPGWMPDEVVCDAEGKLADALGVKDLPHAFLWSWRGQLLKVAAGEDYLRAIENAVEEEMRRLPRALLDPKMRKDLDAVLRTAFGEAGKIDIVAAEDTQAELARIRKGGGEVQYDSKTACQRGILQAPNALIKASVVGDQLLVDMYDAESGCLRVSASTAWKAGQASACATAAVKGIVDKLRQPVEMPGVAPPKEYFVKFESEPSDASVDVDGKGIGLTSCTGYLKEGQRRVRMTRPGYDVREETVEVRGDLTLHWKLESAMGRLEVSTVPPALRVRVKKGDRVVWHDPPPQGGVELEPGSYEVTTADERYHMAREVVEVKKGTRVAVKLAPEPRLGYLKVKAFDKRTGQPVPAEVTAGGKKLGSAPGPWQLMVGTYDVVVSAKGYPDEAFSVQVEVDATVEKEVYLADSGGLVWLWSEPAKVFFTKSEVTWGQYNACVAAGECTEAHASDGTCWVWAGSKWGKGTLPTSFQGDDQPVVCVDWGQADAYCKWAGARLPTEEEWAAEASNGGKRGYPWGNTTATCALAVMDDGGMGCGKDRTWPVCSKGSGNSVSGLCDMAGNVWEWTSSLWDSEHDWRVVRGGSWNNVDSGLRASYRYFFVPGLRSCNLGFRCVRSSQ